MADKRINALATTASSTASDDFIAVDGTTNGTRKLSAFSPTFGGNATVTGTLTVNGATAFVGANTGSPYVLIKGGSSGTNGGGSLVVENGSGGSVIGIGNVSAIAGGAYNNDPVVWYAGSESLRFYNASTEVANFSSTGVLSLLSTTASTTTSTGALVVGNGTSGGLGVGGSINTGGTLRFHTNANLPGVGSIGISATYGLNMYASTGSSYDFTVFNAAGSSLILNPTGTQNLTLPGVITLSSSTASTTTSSGALVVSGGVGVAGAVNAGTFYGLVDGVTAPATESGYARIYVDSADGDLKVKFGDGTVKTIATDS